MRYRLFNHQGKAAMVEQALQDAGYVAARRDEHADIVLVDTDDPDAPGRGRLLSDRHALKVMYPHGALPTYHGYYQPDNRVDVQLVHGPGLATLVQSLGLGREVVTVGWSYSPTVEFHAPRKVRRVLFGPTHPYGSGFLEPAQKTMNRQVLDALGGLDVELAVQLCGIAAANGIPAGRYVRSDFSPSWTLVDWADVVVANGTLGCLALARGKPTVMFGQSLPNLDEHSRTPVGPVVVMPDYPVDFDDGPLPDLFAAACADAGGWWREQFVGGPFDQRVFLDVVSEVEVAA